MVKINRDYYKCLILALIDAALEHLDNSEGEKFIREIKNFPQPIYGDFTSKCIFEKGVLSHACNIVPPDKNSLISEILTARIALTKEKYSGYVIRKFFETKIDVIADIIKKSENAQMFKNVETIISILESISELVIEYNTLTQYELGLNQGLMDQFESQTYVLVWKKTQLTIHFKHYFNYYLKNWLAFSLQISPFSFDKDDLRNSFDEYTIPKIDNISDLFELGEAHVINYFLDYDTGQDLQENLNQNIPCSEFDMMKKSVLMDAIEIGRSVFIERLINYFLSSAWHADPSSADLMRLKFEFSEIISRQFKTRH